ncbi:MAG: 4Fe-4S binding protein [Candidatus Bathyarchaeota archaeon]|jgi:polyferredoxin
MLEKKQKSGTATRVKSLIFRIETLRKIVQLGFFALFNAVVFGLAPWPVLLPIIGLLGTPSKTVGDALGALQLFLFEVTFPWFALASVFVAAIFLGRALCGWACPFGFVQDLLVYVKRRHTEVSPRTHGDLVKVKYVILAVVLFVSGTLAVSLVAGIGESYKEALGVFAKAPFNAVSPADTLFAVVPRIALEIRYGIPQLLESPADEAYASIGAAVSSLQPLLLVRLIIMGLIIGLAVYVPRGWCRYLCPQGAFSALFSKFSFLGLRREPVRCTKAGCRDCVQVCPTLVPILDLPWEKFTHSECIYCLKCVDACSTKAIKPKFP